MPALSELNWIAIAVATLVSGGLGVATPLGGVGIGIVSMTMLSDALFSGWGSRLYFIQVGYRVTYIVLSAGILGGWPAQV
jgi:hypothetical protein